MALTGFTHSVRWNQFREVRQRPQGSHEDAFIRARFSYNYATRGNRVTSVNLTIAVARAESWVVRGQQSATLLQHEQGHYDITALGAREVYNRILGLSGSNIGQQARQIEQQVQGQIDAANRRYDTQTTHGTNRTAQQRWEARIRTAKQQAGGTIADLPQ